MSTQSTTPAPQAREGETLCVACAFPFASEPGPPICGACFTRPGQLAYLMGAGSPDRRRDLVAEWTKAAEFLETTAKAFRSEGDSQYAAELEASASDYRIAAERLV